MFLPVTYRVVLSYRGIDEIKRNTCIPTLVTTLCRHVRNSPKWNSSVITSQQWKQKTTKSRFPQSRRPINPKLAISPEFVNDLKSNAVSIFKFAVNSVKPRKMVENVLQYDNSTSTLTVLNKVYNLHRNISIVGFGKATMGMARAVEDVLGEHIVSGIISIPRGLPQEMAEAQQFDSLLPNESRIEIHEGSPANEVHDDAHEAAKAIQGLVTELTGTHIVIVLCSGGGSELCPSPCTPISMSDLLNTTRLLEHHGASLKDVNIVRKNIESLKGGGLVMAAKPAQVLCLILSSIIGDSVDLIGGGPTYPCPPSPHHCLQIMQRLGVTEKIPTSVKTFLDKMKIHMDITQNNEKNRLAAKKVLEEQWTGVQNVIVGNNSVACEAAAKRAEELGYLPLILTKELRGEARNVGALYGKLAKFITMCFDSKVSLNANAILAQLEIDLIMSGMKKPWLNRVTTETEKARHLKKDVCVIAGGEMVVNVVGDGVGGKNLECALGAVSQIKEDLVFEHAVQSGALQSGAEMAFLSADTDGHDGVTKMAGAVVDKNFVCHAVKDIDVDRFLDRNDSLTLFKRANDGRNLIETKLTGTKLMDMLILLVKRPEL